MSAWNQMIPNWLRPAAERNMELARDQQATNFYDIPPDVLNQLKKDSYAPFYRQTLNLGTAQTQPLLINVPGTAVVIRGHDNGTQLAVDTTVLVYCQFEKASTDQQYPLKHNFGFCGPFTSLWLTWPQQQNGGASRYADIIIYKGLFRPWIDGSAAT